MVTNNPEFSAERNNCGDNCRHYCPATCRVFFFSSPFFFFPFSERIHDVLGGETWTGPSLCMPVKNHPAPAGILQQQIKAGMNAGPWPLSNGDG